MYSTINSKRIARPVNHHGRASAHEVRVPNHPTAVIRTQPSRSNPEPHRLNGLRRPHPLLQRTAAWK